MAQNSNQKLRMQKRLKLLRQVHLLESKTDNLTKVPAWVPELQEIQVLFPKAVKRYRKSGILYPSNLSELQIYMIKDKVAHMVQEGYTVSEIAKINRITEAWTREILKERGLKTIRPFKYLIKEEGYLLYATSKIALLKYYSKFTNDTTFHKKFEREHNIEQGKFHWYEIPVGAIYIEPAPKEKGFIIKIK